MATKKSEAAKPLPPLLFTVAIDRNTNTLSIANSITIQEQAVPDIQLLLEAFSSITRDLNESLVNLKVEEQLHSDKESR